jgi:hypothetical protein
MGKSYGRSNDGYMEDYNYHDWSKFMVRKPEEKPKGPHFAAVMFDTRTEYTPAYDEKDYGSSSSVPEIQYFAFPDKETLGAWLLRAKKDNKSFFFFEVKKLGEMTLKVAVDVETDV